MEAAEHTIAVLVVMLTLLPKPEEPEKVFWMAYELLESQ